MTQNEKGDITGSQLMQLDRTLAAIEDLAEFAATDFVGDDERMIKAVADASRQVKMESINPSEMKAYIDSKIPMCETARKRVEEYNAILDDINLLSGDVQMQTILKRILRFCAPDECCGENKNGKS